jgi:hypothetical protein
MQHGKYYLEHYYINLQGKTDNSKKTGTGGAKETKVDEINPKFLI